MLIVLVYNALYSRDLSLTIVEGDNSVLCTAQCAALK